LPYVEAATIALIALILLIAFRAIGPPLVTLGAAALSYAISVRLLTWIADGLGVQVPREVQPVLVALLLGLTTDYSVFFFSGVKRSLASGERRVRAAEQTTRLFLPIIVTAGLIVAFGSASLIVGRLGFFRALGPGMAVTVLVTLAVAVTVIPATLAIFGRALFWPGLRPDREEESSSRLRRSLGRFATWRPVALVLTIGAAAVLLLGACHARSTVLGLDLLAGLPGSDQVKRAADDAGKGFAPGIVSPTELLVEGQVLRDDQAGLAKLQRRLSALPVIAGVIGAGYQPSQIHEPVFVSSAGNAARFALVLDDDPLGAHAIHTLQQLREDLPGLLSASGLRGARAGLAGDTALADDTVTTIHSDIARVALALLLANFVLLALFLQAVLAALPSRRGVLALAIDRRRHVGLPTLQLPGSRLRAVCGRGLLLSLGTTTSSSSEDLAGGREPALPRGDHARCAAPPHDRDRGRDPRRLLRAPRDHSIRHEEAAFVMSVGVLIDGFWSLGLVPSLIATFGRISWWPRRPPDGAQRQLERSSRPNPPSAGRRVAWRPRERRLARGGLHLESCNCEAICPCAGSTGSWADVRPRRVPRRTLVADRGRLRRRRRPRGGRVGTAWVTHDERPVRVPRRASRTRRDHRSELHPSRVTPLEHSRPERRCGAGVTRGSRSITRRVAAGSARAASSRFASPVRWQATRRSPASSPATSAPARRSSPSRCL
jgi:RND superfamily putative drug exporter